MYHIDLLLLSNNNFCILLKTSLGAQSPQLISTKTNNYLCTPVTLSSTMPFSWLKICGYFLSNKCVASPPSSKTWKVKKKKVIENKTYQIVLCCVLYILFVRNVNINWHNYWQRLLNTIILNQPVLIYILHPGSLHRVNFIPTHYYGT